MMPGVARVRSDAVRFEFEFYSSEIERVEVDGATLRVHFSAAHLHRGEGPGATTPGYAGQFDMVFEQAVWDGEPALCIGGLADGDLTLDGVRRSRLALPLDASGDVQAHFRLISGTMLAVRAARVRCATPDPERFVASYAC